MEISWPSKEVKEVFKLMAPGGKATPAPPLGPVLGAKGVNPGQFIQQFNAATSALNGKVVGCVSLLYMTTVRLSLRLNPHQRVF